MDNILNDSKETLFFLKDDKLERITFVRDEDCENERDFCEPLSTIIWNTGNRHHVGGSSDDVLRDVASDWEDYFYKQNYDTFQNMSQEDYDKLSIEEMKNIWAESKFVCLPLNYREHSSALPIILYTQDEKEFSNDGYIFVDKDNKEVQDYLKSHSEAETKEWAKGVIEAEIKSYNMYLQGEVYGMLHDVYNEESKQFEQVDSLWGIYIDDIFKGEESKNVMEVISENTTLDKTSLITEKQAVEFQTDNHRLKKQFFSEANKLLPEFENNPVLVYRAVANTWNKTRPEDMKIINNEIKENCKSETDFNFELFKNLDMKLDFSNFASIAIKILDPKDLGNWLTDLYLRKNERTDLMFARWDNEQEDWAKLEHLRMAGTVSTFRDQIENVPFYEFKSILPTDFFAKCLSIHSKTEDEFEKVRYFGTEGEKINKMFDTVYNFKDNIDYKDMHDFIEHSLISSGRCYDDQLKGERWWKAACEHSTQGGGQFWKDTHQKLDAMVKVGLESPGSQNYDRLTDAGFDKLMEKTERKYANYFFEYLKNNRYINPSVSPNMEKEKKDPEISR